MNKSQSLKIICPTIECGNGKSPVDNSLLVFVKSSFKLKYQFVKTINKTEVIPINPRQVNFVFEYYTLDNKESFIASHLFGCSTNLFINEKDCTFNVIVYKPGLEIGKLMVNYRFINQDEDFIYGKKELSFGEETGIKLTDDPCMVTKPDNFSLKTYDLNGFPYNLIVSFC